MATAKEVEKKIEIDLRGVLDRNKQALINQLEKAAEEGFAEAIKERGQEAMDEVLEEFIKKEIKPAMKKKLVEMKASILQAFIDGIEDTASEVGKKLFATAKKNLSSDYKFHELVKAIFGLY